MAMAGESDQTFLQNKVVADFGCGPRGSLAWIDGATQKFGIDVLAHRHADEFTGHTLSHWMTYIKSAEKVIRIPTGSVDVMLTLNAIDHVDNFSAMYDEIIRVIEPGGEFIGSFNTGEPVTPFEPQHLTEEFVQRIILLSDGLAKGPEDDAYAPFFSGNELSYYSTKEGFLWVRATNPMP